MTHEPTAEPDLWRHEEVLPVREGGATAAADPMLDAKGLMGEGDEVVLFNTGSGLEYVRMTPLD